MEIFRNFSQNGGFFEDELLDFVEKQMKHSYVVQSYWWIFKSKFIVDSPYPPISLQNTMATCGQQCKL